MVSWGSLLPQASQGSQMAEAAGLECVADAEKDPQPPGIM